MKTDIDVPKLKSTVGSTAAAKTAGISLRQLYYWVELGLIEPEWRRHGKRTFRHYTSDDVLQLTKMARLVRRGYTVSSAYYKVRESMAERERHLTNLRGVDLRSML